MSRITADQKGKIIDNLTRYISSDWLKRNLITGDDYIQDFTSLADQHAEINFYDLVDWYFETAGDVTEARLYWA